MHASNGWRRAAHAKPFAAAPKLNAFNLVIAGPLLEPNQITLKYGNRTAGRGEFHSGATPTETNSQKIRIAKVLAQVLKDAVAQGVCLKVGVSFGRRRCRGGSFIVHIKLNLLLLGRALGS